jgi:alpha-tubulin suppressor-like RCC1 family protein
LIAVFAFSAFTASAGAVTAPQVSTNWYQTCVLSDLGAVSCVGDNARRSLGDATVGKRDTYAPVALSGPASRLSAGEDSVCAVMADTSVQCWGHNNALQLGRGGVSTADEATPAAVQQNGGGVLTGVKQLSGQDATYCAVKVDETLWCWGDNGDHQLADSTTSDSSVAKQIPGLTGVTKVATGDNHVCAIVTAGDVYCWGYNSSGQVGDGTTDPVQTPKKLDGISGAVDIGAGDTFTCATVSDGTLKCWGSDGDGQQGNGSASGTEVLTPSTVPGITGVIQLAVGYESVCTLDQARNLSCWGYNGDNQVTAANTDDVTSPMVVPGAAGAVAVAEQWDETPCTLRRGGGIRCWGNNSHAQAGVANSLAAVTVPTDIAGVDLVTQPWAAASAKLARVGKPKLDRKRKNYTVVTSATIAPNLYVLPAEACTGSVGASAVYTYYVKKRVKVKGKTKIKRIKKKKTYKAKGAIAISGENCMTDVALKLPVKQFAGKKVKITQTTTANGSLTATTASVTVKLAKVKKKKKK